MKAQLIKVLKLLDILIHFPFTFESFVSTLFIQYFSRNHNRNKIDVYCVYKDLHLYLISGTSQLSRFIFRTNNVTRPNPNTSLRLRSQTAILLGS